MKKMISMFYFLVCLQNEVFSFPHEPFNLNGIIEREVDSFVQIEYAEIVTQNVDDDFISVSFNIAPPETETNHVSHTDIPPAPEFIYPIANQHGNFFGNIIDIQLHNNANQREEQEELQNQQANNYFMQGMIQFNIFNYEIAARYFEAAHNLGHIRASHQLMFCDILRGSNRKIHIYKPHLFSQNSFKRH